MQATVSDPVRGAAAAAATRFTPSDGVASGRPAGAQCPPEACADCGLRTLPAFTPVTDEEIGFIQHLRRGVARFRPGQSLLAEHASSDKLYTIYSGWAFRYKTLSDGRRQILNFLLPGDFVGLQQQFAGNAAHGVEAVTDVVACMFPQTGLWELFRTHPALGYDVTWLAAREEQIVDENLLAAGRRNATERVAMLLIHLYRRAQRVGMERGGSIVFPFNQQHIADALGLSLVHTNKTLQRLQRLGLHRTEHGRLFLLDAGALASLAEYPERPLRQLPLI